MKKLYKINYTPLKFLITSVLFILLINDTKAQTVAITAPTVTNYLIGDVISATATATAPALGTVNKVTFTLGPLATVTDASSPYTASFNTSTLAAGSYTLTVINYYTPFLGTQTTKSTTLTINIASGTIASTYSNYAFSKVLTLNSASLGITSNLANFPALVYIQDNALKIGGACADEVQYPNGTNYDFAFTNPYAVGELNYQIEKYDPVAGTLLVWVKIPSLTYAANTPVYFYWGSKTPPVTHDNTFFGNTWTSDYQAVYHFNESPYTGSVADGTAGGHTGTATGMTSADLVTGKIGTAYTFDGLSKKITTNAVSVTGPFTLSAWVKLAAIGLDQKVMTNQAAGGGTSGGYKMGVYSTNIPESESGTAVNRASTPNPTAFAIGAWHYIQSVYTGSTLSTYVDGTQYKILTTSTNPTANPNLYIGVGEGGTMLYFNGLIDEPRVSNVAKTADWIKAEYGNQNSPTTFTTGTTVVVNQTNAAAIGGALVYTFKGVTTPYTDPTNWDNTTTGVTNQAPAFDGTATLIIPTGKNLTLNSAASVYGITLNGTATVTLNGFNLNVGCNIYNQSTGKIDWNNNNTSKITWNGSGSAQSYNGATSTAYAHVGTMEVNNSAGGTITVNNDTLDIYHELKITKGNLAVASGAIMTLKSYAAQTAEVPAIPSPYKITGTVNVERFFTGGAGYRGYRLVSSPVNTGTNIYSINYLIGSSYITGTTGIPGGFDQGGNPTLYLYRENLSPTYNTFLTSNFRGVNTISGSPNYLIDGDAGTFNIPVGNGFLFFFRGDRNVATVGAETTTTYVPTNTTATAKGTLNQGADTVKNWYTPTSSYLGYTTTAGNTAVRGYNLVGNPYPSAIDWDQYSSTVGTAPIYGPSITKFIYVLDPITKAYGVYGAGLGGSGTNHSTNIISSGQGFFVQATSNPNPQLIFNESAKVTTQVTGVSLLMGKPKGQDISQYLRLQLSADSINNEDILIFFNDTAKTQFVVGMDAPYKPGFGKVSLSSLSSDQVLLAINEQPFPKQSENIGLNIGTTIDGVYHLSMKQIASIPQLYDIWLMDNYKKDSLDLRHNPTYSFNVIKSDSASFGAKRFSLVVRQNPAYAYRLLDFTATKLTTATQVQVVWKTENEQDYTNFTVERSTDGGKTFNVVGGLQGSGEGTYSLIDKSPVIGQNIYMLKQEDINNTITYSKVVLVQYSNLSNNITAGNISIYPNPATNIINLVIATKPDENASYSITVTNSLGITVKQATSAQPVWQSNIGNLLPGNYIVRVVNNKDNSLVGETKFVKL